MQCTPTHMISTLTPQDHPRDTTLAGQGSAQQVTPQTPLRAPPGNLHTPNTMSSAVLHDVVSGKELNVDGTLKYPNIHPDYGVVLLFEIVLIFPLKRTG